MPPPVEGNGRVETLIVGGGISGLACARTLHDAGRPFLLVTDRLGGRMYHSADGSMNFGATYINADYRHVSRYVDRGLPFRLSQVCGEAGGRPVTFLHWRNLRSLRPLARLVRRLCHFRLALRAFRKDAERAPHRAIAPHHPLIDRYRRQPAAELIRAIGLGSLQGLGHGPDDAALNHWRPAPINPRHSPVRPGRSPARIGRPRSAPFDAPESHHPGRRRCRSQG
jgi:glycine/D-amino acid oxidase-like deaminating enzyme